MLCPIPGWRLRPIRAVSVQPQAAQAVGGDMGKVVSNTAQLSNAHRKAMAVYVKSLPAVEGPKRPQN